MTPSPIETVVIRDLVRVPRPSSLGFSDEQERAVGALLGALHCPVRRRVLVALCAAGRATVGALGESAGLPHATVSHHLGRLKLMGLVHDRREGKHVCYTPAPTRVRTDARPGAFLGIHLEEVFPFEKNLAVGDFVFRMT